MTVKCDQCGKAINRSQPRDHNFCCVECRNRWNSQHVDYAALSRGHRAQHLTELNKERNPHCRVAERGKPNSKKPAGSQRNTSAGHCRQEKSFTT